ncbi:hypothetical protein [Actinoplanes derwentensis]|uniref:Uncharacterized protein n=1 Tax=Actinoplanes derwentensis TaxID=113562 RepID=A0A1H1W035_9ACTN|nr:hypothetical protein [Actinoplanes derwentensis]GID84010.1 hypothetical protein Ade03nite_29340 [Actinoplanes derwentensis]SDS90618.1 hypothetical protein SAMN04489716_1945 [Actinoplanes derwentensis]
MFEFEDETTEAPRDKNRLAAMSRSFLLMIGLATVALAAAAFLAIWIIDVLPAQNRT